MKKCLLCITVLLATNLVFTSSVSAAERPSFGILGGPHFADLAIDPHPIDASLASIWRPNIGGFVELGLNRSASLQARCMYVPKGAALEDIAEVVDLNASLVVDYVTVPVLLKLQADTPKIRPYAVVGPEIGFKVGTGAAVSSPTASVPQEAVNMLASNLYDQVETGTKSTDVAIDFGGGIEIPSGRFSILMEGIYSLGLRSIAIPAEGEEGSAKTRAFLFNIGARF
jgi:hypothetical protein